MGTASPTSEERRSLLGVIPRYEQHFIEISRCRRAKATKEALGEDLRPLHDDHVGARAGQQQRERQPGRPAPTMQKSVVIMRAAPDRRRR